MSENAIFSHLSWATIAAQKPGKTRLKPIPKQKKVMVAVARLEDIRYTREWYAAAPVRHTQKVKNLRHKVCGLIKAYIVIKRFVRERKNKASAAAASQLSNWMTFHACNPQISSLEKIGSVSSFDPLAWSDNETQPDNSKTRSETEGAWVPKDNETLVDTIDGLRNFHKYLPAIESNVIDWFCDLEGYNLGKPPGTISLMDITSKKWNHTWIIDITVLGKKAFDFMGPRGQSLREMLEGSKIWTAWWDFRNDQNALWFHFGVRLCPRTTMDLSILELATRCGSRDRRLGLATAIEFEAMRSGHLTREQLNKWSKNNKNGKSYFRYNGYSVFDIIPRPKVVMEYAAGDTEHMSMLLKVYMDRMRYGKYSMEDLRVEMERTLIEVCTEEYLPNGSYRGEHSWAPVFFTGEKHFADEDDFYD